MQMQQPMGYNNTTSTSTTTHNVTNIVNAGPERSPKSSPRTPRSDKDEAEEPTSNKWKYIACCVILVILAGLAVVFGSAASAAWLLAPFEIKYDKKYKPMMTKFFKFEKRSSKEFGWTDGFSCKPQFYNKAAFL